jgi:hypothetical protein
LINRCHMRYFISHCWLVLLLESSQAKANVTSDEAQGLKDKWYPFGFESRTASRR